MNPTPARTHRPNTGIDFDAVHTSVDEVLHAFLNRKATRAADSGLPDEATDLCHGLACCLRHSRNAARQPCAGSGGIGNVPRIRTRARRRHGRLRHSPRPATLHRQLAAKHQDRQRAQSMQTAPIARRVGENCAILIGDIALCWSDELLHTAGLTPDQLMHVLPLVDRDADRVDVRPVPGHHPCSPASHRLGRTADHPPQDCQVHDRTPYSPRRHRGRRRRRTAAGAFRVCSAAGRSLPDARRPPRSRAAIYRAPRLVEHEKGEDPCV